MPTLGDRKNAGTSADIQPHAGESGFDDSSWATIEAKALDERRGGGKVFFTWYRTNLTLFEGRYSRECAPAAHLRWRGCSTFPLPIAIPNNRMSCHRAVSRLAGRARFSKLHLQSGKPIAP
jgi:hypothetical protein